MSGRPTESQSFLLKLSDALRPLADPVAVQQTTANLLGQHLNADRSFYWDVTGANVATSTHGFSTGRDQLPETIDLKDFGAQLCQSYSEGKTWVSGDVANDPRLSSQERAAWSAAGLCGGIGVPLRKDGKLRAILGVNNATPRKWTLIEIALMEDVAERTWAAVERARAEAALRKSEARLAALIDQVPIGVAMFDTDGRYTFKNSRVTDLVSEIIPSRDSAMSPAWEAFDAEGHRVPKPEFPGNRALRGESALTPVDFRRMDQPDRWVRVTAVPTFDDQGNVSGGISVLREVTAERRIQAEMQVLAARHAEIFESISDAFYAVDREWKFTYVNRKAEELWSHSRNDLIGKSIWEVFDEAIGAEAYRALQRAAEARQVTRLEMLSPLLHRWIDLTIYPASDGGLSVYSRDITPRRQAEKKLKESEARFREFAEASSDVIWFRDAASLLLEYASPAFEAISGMEAGELLGEDDFERWLLLVHRDDRQRMRAHVDHVRAGERRVLEFRIVRPIDGEIRWMRDTTFPLYDDQGRVHRIGGIGHDITELRRVQKELQTRQDVVVSELQDRTRNLMSVVRSVMDRSLRGRSGIEDFTIAYRNRLDALARAQRLLSRLGDGERVAFDELLRSELMHAKAIDAEDHGENVSLNGPFGIRLHSASLQPLALALHELTSNALRHGALSPAGGHLAVSWRVIPASEDSRLRVDWVESGVTMPNPGNAPSERAPPFQLHAKTTYEVGPDGVHCFIDLPLFAGLVEPETESG